MNENINNTVETVETTQNVNNTEAAENDKVSLGKRIWNGTKKTAEVTTCAVLTVGYVAINVAAVALPLAACIKYLRED